MKLTYTIKRRDGKPIDRPTFARTRAKLARKGITEYLVSWNRDKPDLLAVYERNNYLGAA